jgi:DNA-binding GntR family transcriptional regulator
MNMRSPKPLESPPPKAGADTVDRTTLAYRQLREAIVHGHLAPGARVVETEVAKRLGISRTPVRAALQRLQQDGYIVSPGAHASRPQVAPLTGEDAWELFGIVGQIEALAARWAAEKPQAERETLAARLKETNDEFLRVARGGRPDPNALFELDMRFHLQYVEAGAGPRLLTLHRAIKPQAERYVRLYISAFTDEIPTSVREHEEIVRALGAGDPDRSQRAVETNWTNAAQRLDRVIQTLGERGSW